MSIISIKGIKMPKKRNMIRRAANHMINDIIGDRMYLDIQLVFSRYKETDNLYGDCQWIDDPVRPRMFYINIDTAQNLREQLKTLAHELVHVKQYCRGELYDYQRGDTDRCRWRNRIINSERTKYKNLPWEIEAFSFQTPMVNKFLKETKTDLKEYDQCY